MQRNSTPATLAQGSAITWLPRAFAFAFLALLLGACTDRAGGPTGASPHDAELVQASAPKFWENSATVSWNEVARGLVIQNSSNAFFAMRGFAILGLAQYNALIAAEQGKDGKIHPSPRAAVIGASAVALAYLYPSNAAALETLVDEQLAAPAWPGETHTDAAAGEALGRAAAEQVVERAKTDNFFATWTGTVPTGPCLWFSTATPPAPPLGALFGQARPYFLVSGDQFRPQPPPACGSPEYLESLAEVRNISDTRTPEQDAIAKFWALPAGTYQPPGYWNDVAGELAVRYRLNERDAAHLFALMNMVGFDALIASHDGKFAYWHIRPSQADPGIQLAVGLPNFPSYPANHATLSAAMARILGATFPAERARLDGLAEEAALSRVYGGIHFRFDTDAGLVLGRRVAAWALAHDVVGHEPFVLN